MTCTLYDGSTVQALGFTTHPCSRTCPTLGFAHPSERYLQIVRVGIAASGIDAHYQAWLEELQPYRCVVSHNWQLHKTTVTSLCFCHSFPFHQRMLTAPVCPGARCEQMPLPN
jgi:hypothetical protein